MVFLLIFVFFSAKEFRNRQNEKMNFSRIFKNVKESILVAEIVNVDIEKTAKKLKESRGSR